ncbi:cell wall-binding repeat-containing protein [uncultured Mobiluncus sp.]|uniref:cell wall-binding repeat-containing protein n=1 Tax=uncultured Mobiluncus sp. TaxID=293425 RepID=UPI0025CC7705|nr:cell wall-binding repeat-containing protein [uncultured Mobiluncus sp.]
MNLKKKFVIGAASLALVAGMGVAPAMANAGDKIVLPGGQSFDRIAGAERVETSLKVAMKAAKDDTTGKKKKKVYLVNYTSMVDAASSGILNDGVVVLVPADKAGQIVVGHQIKKLIGTGVIEFTAVGGTGVVPNAWIDNVVAGYDNGTPTISRLGGKDRYATNIEIIKKAKESGPTWAHNYFAQGNVVVDALTAGAVTDGPIILVPPTGDVPQGTVDYYQKNLTNKGVIVLGGTGALSDDQVNKVTGGKERINPWKYNTTIDSLKADVQTAAAKYYGQGAWQHMTKDVLDVPNNNYLGLGKAAINGTSADENDINIKDEIATGKEAKAFKGWKNANAEVAANLAKIMGKADGTEANTVNKLKKEMNTALDTLVTPAGKAPADVATGQTVFLNKFKAYYGFDAQKLVVNADGSVTPGGFTTTGDVVSGYDFAAADKKAQQIAESSDNLLKIGAEQFTYADAVGYEATDFTTFQTNAASSPVSAAAMGIAAPKKAAEVKAQANKCFQALKDAVNAYNAGPLPKVITSTGTYQRLAGADRYETAALLSYYLTAGPEGKNDGQLNGKKRVYVASGNDANIVDAMVAGQLEEGPILLLPSTGTPSDNVLAEFKRLGMTQGKTMKEGFTIGGTGAVSDDTLKAAVKSFAEGLKDQPEAPAASSATPTTTNGAADIVTASGTTTFTIKGVAGASWAITGGNAKLTLDKTSGTFADTTPVTITVTGSGLTNSDNATVTYKVTQTESGKAKSAEATATVKIALP